MKTIRSSRDIILQTTSWPEAVEFYEKVLGLSVIHRSDSLIGFETGAFCLYLEKGAGHGPVFDFLTPQVAALRDKLVSLGCQLVEENPSVPRCYIRDPFGLTFNLGTSGSGK